MSTNVEENYYEVIQEITNNSMSEIDLFEKYIGAHIDKFVNLAELKFGKLDRTKESTTIGLCSFHDEVNNGIQFFN